MKSVHSGRIERWLGTPRIEELSANFKDWYGPPVNLIDVPGSVWIGKDGDFTGDFDRGFFDSAADALARYGKRLWKATGRSGVAGAGFTSISDALARASGGFGQTLTLSKTGITGVATAPSSLWTAGGNPGVGAIGSAAPGGRAPTVATAGAVTFSNPASGTNHLVGADFVANVINMSLLIYDRIFDVAKTMNSNAAESVTGVPTRYQSSTPGAADFAGGNFMFPEIITTLAATAHTWDAVLYRDQDGNDAQTATSLIGINGGIASRLDINPLNRWFALLAAGDSGVMDLNSMKLDTAVATGTLDWVIGHPIGVMAFPILGLTLPFDWLTNRNQAPRVFDDACLAFLELPKPTTTGTLYAGMLHLTSAA